MDNFTPIKTVKEKKKINRFLIIGNLLLAVFVAVVGLVYYNSTLITTQQQAKSPKDIAASKAKQAAEAAAEAAKEAKKKAAQDAKRAAKVTEANGQGGCVSGQTFCKVTLSNGKSQGLCIPDTAGGCNEAAVDAGYSVQTGGGSTKGTGGWRCVVGVNGYSGGPCTENNYAEIIGNTKVPACFCGVIQIDNASGGGTYQSNCGCGSKQQAEAQIAISEGTIIPTPTGETPTDIPTSTPTETIVPTQPIDTPTDVPATIPPTIASTETPTVTPGGPSPTPGPLVCATKDCNETTRKCAPGNVCIKANDGSNYCSNESLVDSCKSSPTENSCCKIAPTSNATPTEIIVAKVSPTKTVVLLKTGTISLIHIIPGIILLLGFLL